MKIDWVLLKRSVLSDISEEERNLLNAWLDESSEHREFYREIKTFLCSPESFRPTGRTNSSVQSFLRSQVNRCRT